jgi:PqqD family protein of HPr-rel-A system
MAKSASESDRPRRSASSNDLLWATWNDEHAVFHRPSGKTHFLNDTGARLIQEILTKPKSVDDAARALAGASVGDDCDAEFIQQVDETMQRLEQIGLIEPA